MAWRVAAGVSRARVCRVLAAVLMAAMYGAPGWAAILTFAPYTAIATGGYPEAVAIGDIDGDGRNDVVLSTSFSGGDPAHDNKLHIFFQNPDGTLAPPVLLDAGDGKSVAIADINGDGRADLVTSYGIGIGVRINLGGRTFAPATFHATSAPPRLVQAADLTGSGRIDLVTLVSDSVVVFRQQPDGTLGAGVQVASSLSGGDDFKLGDLDGDGLVDIVVLGSGTGTHTEVHIVRQLPGETFAVARTVLAPTGLWSGWGVAVADVDGDAQLDIIVSQLKNSPTALYVIRNQQMLFVNVLLYPTYDIAEPLAVGDIDMDGIADVVTLHGGWVAAGVYRRNEFGGLEAERLFPIPYASHYWPRALAIDDFNGDGRSDIAIADSNNGLVVLRNTTPYPEPGGAQRKRDFNGDGRYDILYRNATTGEVALTLMDGASVSSGALLLVDPAWRVTNVADTNGDARSDLVWRNETSGATAMWLMNGTQPIGYGTLLIDAGWRVTHAADLDGDGRGDVLWRNDTTGQTAAWLMNGTTMASGAILVADRAWQVTHAGDLDGDGKADLIWRNHGTGDTAIWRMNATALSSGRVVLRHPAWRVAHVADLDGDGNSDLLWHNPSTGETAAWLMHGTTMLQGRVLLRNPTWSVVLTGDFDGDGNADLVWDNGWTGATAIWLMNGTSMSSGAIVSTNADWTATHVADLDGDGRSDIVWRNLVTGEVRAWLMNGLSFVGWRVLSINPAFEVTPPQGR